MSTERVKAEELRPGDRVLDNEGEPGEVLAVVPILAAWSVPAWSGVEVEYAPRPGEPSTMEDVARYRKGEQVERVV